MKAMILAAGRGKRMQPLTDKIPKPLLKIGDVTLIEHHLFALAQQGYDEVIINVSHLAQQIMNLLGSGDRYGLEIIYSHEKQGALETGGGILNALPLLGKDPFLVISADIWTNFPFGQFFQHNLGNELAHIVLVDNPVYHLKGDFDLHKNKVLLNGGKRLTYANIGVYHPDLFKNSTPGVFPLGPLLCSAIEKGQVTGEHFAGVWSNIGTVEIWQEVLEQYTQNNHSVS